MGKIEKQVKGNFSKILKKIEDEIVNGSLSASLEDKSDFISGDARCSIRVFERYSWSGSNRVSLNVTLFQNSDSNIYISGVSSGGSQGIIFKINKIGEITFLDKLKAILDEL